MSATTDETEGPDTSLLPAKGPRRPGRLRRWLFRKQEIADARVECAQTTPEQAALLVRASAARELAFRIEEPIDPLPRGHGLDSAIELYRQSAYWVLLAEVDPASRPSPRELWDRARSSLAQPLEPADGSDVLERLVTDADGFVAAADLPEADLRPRARTLRAFVDRQLDTFDAPTRRLRRLLVIRTVSVLALLSLLTAVVVTAIVLLIPKRPDLASGKPWTTSSSLYPCNPKIPDCGGVRTRILFHTKDEPSPWFQVDLGAPTAFSALTVRNRHDFGPERAVPLVAEVSQDGKKFEEVARRDKSFKIWEPEFETRLARYVRVRSTRRTILHLEGLQVHP